MVKYLYFLRHRELLPQYGYYLSTLLAKGTTLFIQSSKYRTASSFKISRKWEEDKIMIHLIEVSTWSPARVTPTGVGKQRHHGPEPCTAGLYSLPNYAWITPVRGRGDRGGSAEHKLFLNHGVPWGKQHSALAHASRSRDPWPASIRGIQLVTLSVSFLSSFSVSSSVLPFPILNPQFSSSFLVARVKPTPVWSTFCSVIPFAWVWCPKATAKHWLHS